MTRLFPTGVSGLGFPRGRVRAGARVVVRQALEEEQPRTVPAPFEFVADSASPEDSPPARYRTRPRRRGGPSSISRRRAPDGRPGAGRPGSLNWERLNSSGLIWPGRSELATSVMPKDLPDPGAPKTAMESGRLWRGWRQYSLTRARMLRKLSISRRSTVSSAPN